MPNWRDNVRVTEAGQEAIRAVAGQILATHQIDLGSLDPLLCDDAEMLSTGQLKLRFTLKREHLEVVVTLPAGAWHLCVQ